MERCGEERAGAEKGPQSKSKEAPLRYRTDMETESMAPSSSAAAAATKLLVEITTDGIPKLHCPVCNKALVSLAGYVKHVKKHQPPGGFECRHCDARFCHEEELTQHAKDEHGVTGAVAGQERKPFVCEKCGAEYKYQEAYRRHCRTKCGEEKLPREESRPMECKCCYTRFSSASNLSKHRRSRPDTCGQPEYDSPGSSDGMKKHKAFRKKDRNRDSDDEDTTSEESEDSDDDIPLASRLKTKLKQESQNSDSGDECPDFEPNNSEDDADASGFQLPPPAMVKVEAFDEEDFEYQDASMYVKTESTDIFSNEKDKLLDVLLNEGDGLKPFESLKVEQGAGILDEIAAVPLVEVAEEDVLELRGHQMEKPPGPRKRGRPPKEKIPVVKRKYRKRNAPRSPSPDDSSGTPKRVAKISKKELKERLKMINKMEKSWKCPHCVKIYHIRKPYEKHLRDDHKLNEAEMKEIFKDVDVHAKLDEEVFKCPICSKIGRAHV